VTDLHVNWSIAWFAVYGPVDTRRRRSARLWTMRWCCCYRWFIRSAHSCLPISRRWPWPFRNRFSRFSFH